MAANLNRIVLQGNGRRDEATVDEAVTPGMAVELAADGNYDQVQATQAESLKAGLVIAEEATLYAGKTITDAYAADDKIFLYFPQPGDVIHARVKAAEDIAVGDQLVVEGGGSGYFVEAAGTETKYQLEALEGPGTIDAGGEHVRCRVL